MEMSTTTTTTTAAAAAAAIIIIIQAIKAESHIQPCGLETTNGVAKSLPFLIIIIK